MTNAVCAVLNAPVDSPILLDDEPVDRTAPVARLGLRPGAVLTVRPEPRRTGVRVGRPDAIADGLASTPGPDGTVLLHRAPRLMPYDEPVVVDFPAAPISTTVPRLHLLSAFAPLVLGIALAATLHQWQLAAFAALSPVALLAQGAGDRLTVWRSGTKNRRRHATATAAAHCQFEAALRTESRRRADAAPDPSRIMHAAQQRSRLLWQRAEEDAGDLVLRLGIADLPSEVTIRGDGPSRPTVRAPVVVDLRTTQMLGITGPGTAALGAAALARWLLAQAAVLHGPAALSLVVLAPGGADRWGWAGWLPHAVPAEWQDCAATIATTESQVECRLGELLDRSPHDDDPLTLVVVDTTAGEVDATAAQRVLDASDRLVAIWVSADERHLPPGCRTVAALDPARPDRLHLSRTGAPPLRDVTPDLIGADVAESIARALAPLRDAASVTATLPSTVSWSEINAVPLDDVEHAVSVLRRRWAEGPTTRVALGRAAARSYCPDLRVDGPHALVAGTTGSGKSELLQTLVAGLAAANRPDHLAFVLIDFKGGAAFGACRELPHVVDVVTDLDAATARRALTSLSAELRRRETLLADLGCPDLERYNDAARHRSGLSSPPPRHVIVVDEFATLAEELPDFVTGLVGIAQRGRSLGIHLVLATQRPEGVVSADIRANARLRICLGVARETESRDVLDTPVAARISRTTPGRAWSRAGHNDLEAFQTARVTGAPPSPPAGIVVELAPAALLGARVAPATGADPRPSELDLLVDAAKRAATAEGCRAPVSPWLPALPRHLALSRLPAGPGQDDVAWGIVDLPAEQAQPPLTTSADPTHLLVAGTSRSGRTTAVLSAVTALAMSSSPDRLHLWGLDGGSELAQLELLPHCGGVLPIRDIDRVDRLLTHLVTTMTARRAGRAGRAAEPQLLLAIDGWEQFEASVGDHDNGRCVNLLMRLFADGPGAGLRVVVTSDRGGLTGRLAAAVADKLVLRLADRADFGLAGLSLRDVPTDLPPGRAVRVTDHALVQIAAPDDASAAIARDWAPGHPAPQRFDALPVRVLLRPLLSGPRRAGLVVGLRSDDLTPAVVDPAAIGNALLVGGTARSGRSTALLTIATQLRDRRVVALCPRRSVLHDHPDTVELLPDDPGAALDVLDDVDGDTAVLVDDVDLVTDGALLDRLATVVRRARDDGGLVVLAGAADAMAGSFRGPVVEARRGRAGLLLRPQGPHDGELLGIRLRRRATAGEPPGRGWLALDGVAAAIQVADPR